MRDGQVEVLECWEWHEVTDPMNGQEILPGQPEPAPAGPTPHERLYEQLRAQTKKTAAP